MSQPAVNFNGGCITRVAPKHHFASQQRLPKAGCTQGGCPKSVAEGEVIRRGLGDLVEYIYISRRYPWTILRIPILPSLTAFCKCSSYIPATVLEDNRFTPVNPTHPFELPPTGDTVLDFVNELGYPEPIEFVSKKVVHESSSTSDSERTESDTESGTPKGDKVQGEVVSSTVTSGVSIPVSDPEKAHVAQAGPHPEPMQEDQTGSDSGKLHVSLAGPNPEHMDDEFIEHLPKVTSTPPLIAPFTNVTSSEPSLLVTPPPINTEATTITTSLPEITPFIALQLRVAKLEQEMSEVKKTDVLLRHQTQVPTAVDNYLGTKLDDALLKVLERHTADLIVIYSMLPLGTESSRIRNLKDSGGEYKIKKEQDEEKQDSTYSITDEDAMDKEVADQVKDHKRKHDSDDDEDDDDDEGPSAGSNRADLIPKLEHSEQSSDTYQSRKKGIDSDMETLKMLSIPRDQDYLLTGDKSEEVNANMTSVRSYGSLTVFRRKEFYINKHSESSDREAVRSHMRILSVVSVKVFEKYGYNYLREIILRRADYQEYKISEKDFKNLHPNDFEDLFLLNIQEKLNHLPKTDKTSLHTAVNMWIRNLVIRNRVGDLQLGIESYQTKVNLERPNWDAADYYFKEDYTIVPKPRAVVYRDRNNQRKLMRLNELHKFSDGTAWRPGSGQRMTREEAKTSSQLSRKDYRSEGSIEVWKALLEEE
ncbi:hypothetical protein Tco_1516209 [Tanacetum coccineum]